MTATIPKLVSITHVAEQLDCSRGHVYDLIKAGAFRTVQIGAGGRSKARVYAGDVDAYIARMTSRESA